MLLNTLKLLLPALLPSWNFFDIIAPSPRIEYAVFNTLPDPHEKWFEFRPRPQQLSFWVMLKRMFWNPHWNESLFIMSCAERILENPTQSQHSEDQILERIIAELTNNPSNTSLTTHIQFRLITVQRQNTTLRHTIVYQSRVQSIAGKLK